MPTLTMRLSEPGNLPYISLYHNKTRYNFVVDTGSTLSWTVPEVASKMLLGAEASPCKGSENVRLDSAIRVTLRLDPMTFTSTDDVSYKYSVKLWCGEASHKINEMNQHVKEPLHGILGADFLQNYHVTIDMDRNLLHL